MQTNFPSVKRMASIFQVPTDHVVRAREIMMGMHRFGLKDQPAFEVGRKLESLWCPKTAAWVRSCYHMPSLHGVKMSCLNELLGTHGIEFINLEPGNYTDPNGIEYLNMGDTYRDTLIFFNGKYRIASYGDVLEAWERKHGSVESI